MLDVFRPSLLSTLWSFKMFLIILPSKFIQLFSQRQENASIAVSEAKMWEVSLFSLFIYLECLGNMWRLIVHTGPIGDQ